MKRNIILVFVLGVIALSFSSENNSYSKAKLGALLFNEKILSKDSSVSCASCHKPEHAFSDTMAFSMGIMGMPTRRNTPSVLNMKNRPYYFWDGRAQTLAEQALMPIQNPDEMGLPIEEAINRLRNSAFYNNYFRKVFHAQPNTDNLAAALAAFENTLETDECKLDRWGDNKATLTPEEERGRELFVGDKAKCFNCHLFEDFTNDEFKNIGLFDGKKFNDSGRYLITKNPADIGKFKTPGLRNIAITAPYMHNGMFATLEAVVDFYNDPRKLVPDGIGIDTSLQRPLGLTAQEKKDIVAFLRTLTDKKFETNN